MHAGKVTYERKTRKYLSPAKHSSSLIIKSEVPLFILIKEIKVAMWQLKFEVDYERVPIEGTFEENIHCLVEMNFPVVETLVFVIISTSLKLSPQDRNMLFFKKTCKMSS